MVEKTTKPKKGVRITTRTIQSKEIYLNVLY